MKMQFQFLVQALLMGQLTKSVAALSSALACAAMALLIGCGATSHQVVNKPPAINFSQKPYSVEYGTIAVQNITLFYWPEQNEDQLEVTARTVKTSANRLDAVAANEIEFAMLAGGFVKLECIQNFALATQEQAGSPVPWITIWKSLPDLVVVDPVPEGDIQYENYQNYLKLLAAHKLLAYCQDNQAKRTPLSQWLATKGATEKTEAGNDFASAIGPQNILHADAKGTVIKIVSTPKGPLVDVTIQNFLTKGYSPSTQPTIVGDKTWPPTIAKAGFLTDRRLLVFGVAEMGANGPTGRHFEIKMERGPDFVGMARFSGELNLMDGTTLVRSGQISITGFLMSPDADSDSTRVSAAAAPH